jgi:hypothetical protein
VQTVSPIGARGLARLACAFLGVRSFAIAFGALLVTSYQLATIKPHGQRYSSISRFARKAHVMKVALALVLAIDVISPAPAWSQSAVVVRGVGTQTCKTLAASDQVDEKFALQAAQWILGNVTAYFRQASDNPSRSIGDAILLQTVLDVCKNNPDKTIDEAVSLTIQAMPVTSVPKKPVTNILKDEK